ncbi:MAG: Ig-like domain-containing protein, partial [Nitrospira sp.]|nr:Ig-like domain-containing protein [Nitrospira sp.]
TDTDNPTLGSRTVRYVLTDGDGGTSANYDTTVTLAAVNDVPVIANLGGDTLAYSEGDGAQVIDQGSTAAVTDVDSANFDTGTLTISFTAGSDAAEDVLAIRDQGAGPTNITVAGSAVSYGGTQIGTFTGGSSGVDLVITLDANADATAVSALVQNITYTNTDTDNPTLGSRTVRYVLTDGDGGTSANYDTTVTLAAVNDVPVVVANAGSTVARGGTVPIIVSELQVTDVDNTPAQLTYTVTVVPVNGQLELTTAPGFAINSFTQAQIDAGQVVYVHDGSFTASDSFTFTVSDGAGGNIGATTFGITVTPVNSIPTLAANGGSTVVQGLTDVITASELQVIDLDNGPAQLLYTVMTAPANGQLELTTAPGVAITTFTQADIDAGRVVFVHSGAAATSDSFTFTVSDGAGGTIGATTFTFTVAPFIPPPGGGGGSGGGGGGGGGTGGSGGTGSGSGSGGSGGVVPPPIQPPLVPIGGGLPVKEASVVGATNDPLPRNVITTRTIGRIDQPTIGIQEPPPLLFEPLSVPVKKVLAVGHKLVERLTRLADDLERGVQEREHKTQLIGQVASFSGMALSAGFVAWILRGGALVASFLVSMPAWRHFDPLPVLGIGEGDRRKRDRKVREEDEQEKKQFRGLDRVLKTSRNESNGKRKGT